MEGRREEGTREGDIVVFPKQSPISDPIWQSNLEKDLELPDPIATS